MNRFIFSSILLIAAACATKPKTEQVKIETVKLETTIEADCTGKSAACAGCPEAKSGKVMVVSVDSVQKNPEKYYDKTIALKGRVVHTCKVTGKKMFLTGSDEQNLIRVNAGENISRFDESLQGEIVIAHGRLTPIVDDAMTEMGKKDSTGKVSCETEAKAKKYVLACSTFEIQPKN